MTPPEPGPATLKVVDAFDHPHGHRILRTRVVHGTPPTIHDLKRSSLRAVGPDGTELSVKVLGFPVFGGVPSDARIRDTGRVDLLVAGPGDGHAVSRSWALTLEGR
jgi:hypothetical protein